MKKLPDDAVKALQHEVQRLLGRCLLRLQQYERLMKAILADREISGPTHAWEAIREARKADKAGKTLGALVGELVRSHLVTDESDAPSEDNTNPHEGPITLGYRVTLQLSDTDFVKVDNELKELVLLRNSLVHHFIDRHDLWSLDGCRSAQVALIDAYSRIDQQVEQLREWAQDMVECRRQAAAFVQSDVFHDWFVNGIAPDGTVHWPTAGIVEALREAANELSVDGWVSVAEAGKWIAKRHPEKIPAKYGCSSWRQVVHESRVFELRYFDRDGQRAAYYRGRAISEKLK